MSEKNIKGHIGLLMFSVFYLIYVVLLFWFHPFVASAAEPVPGGVNNKVSVSSMIIFSNGSKRLVRSTFIAKDDYEIVGFYNDLGGDRERPYVTFQLVKNRVNSIIKCDNLSDYVFYEADYDSSGNITKSESATLSMGEIKKTNFTYDSRGYDETVEFDCSGCKIFAGREAFDTYVKTGNLDGMIKEPELDKKWYFKNVGYKVEADDSPTSEAGEDATYITFTWDTDNLQDGDLLEIRTRNHLKKIGGDQISGFHDYITHKDTVSAYGGKYRFSQYDATKAWFATLESKPLFFKSYDTDIYYLRPYRNGKYGGWVKITMGRSTPTSSPYVEDVEYGDFDDDGDWVTDKELTDENGGNHGINQDGEIFYPDADNPFEGTNLAGIFESFFSFMKSIPSLLGELPALVISIVGFLPSFVIGFVALGVVVAIILRIVGR